MAIALDAVSSGTASATHVCSGSSRLLFASCYRPSTTDDGATYNGVAMTLINKVGENSDSLWHFLYYLIAPATGSNTLSMPNASKCGGVSYTGCKQSGVPDNVTSIANQVGSPVTHSALTPVLANSWILLSATQSGSVSGYGGNTTNRVSNGGLELADGNGPISVSTQLTITQASGTAWASIAVTFAENPIALFAATPSISVIATAALTGTARFFAAASLRVSATAALTAASRFNAAAGISISATAGLTGKGTVVTVNGVDQSLKVMMASVNVEDVIYDVPTTCQFTCSGFVPLNDQVVTIAWNSVTEFAGTIVKVDQIVLAQKRSNVAYNVTCQDYTRLFNRRLVVKKWPGSTTITSIVSDIVTNYTSGFTVSFSSSGSVTDFVANFEKPGELLTRLARLAAAPAAWYVNFSKVVKFFPASSGDGAAASITEASLSVLKTVPSNLNYGRDGTAIRTRSLGIGGGSNIEADAAVGTTLLPLKDASMFASGGGSALVDQNVLTYTGKHAGGLTSAVTSSASAPSAPSKVQGNIGQLTLTYRYKVSFVNASGESPAGTATTGISVSAVTTPGQVAFGSLGSGVLTGAYNWRVQFVFPYGKSILGTQNGGTLTANNAPITGIPTGATVSEVGITAREIYRTKANGSEFFLLTVINDDTTTTYTDNTPDNELGSAAILAGTGISGHKVNLSAIPTGPTGTTHRKIYRDQNSSGNYQLVGTISDNSTTTFTDDNMSPGDSALTSPGTQGALAGETSLSLVSASGFATAGWLRVDSQMIKWTGVSGNTLTGVPSSGVGSIASTIRGGASAVSFPLITGIPSSSTGSILVAIAQGATIRIYVERNDTAAQTALAAVEGGDGIHVAKIDAPEIFSVALLTAACDADLAQFKSALQSVEYYTLETTANSGKVVTVTLSSPQSISATLLIQRVVLSRWSMTTAPLRCVTAAPKKFSLQDFLIEAAA